MVAVVLAGLALLAGCGGSDDAQPIRIGVLFDCLPPLDGVRESAVAAVEAPFLRDGATPSGAQPSDGLRGADIGGHPVEISVGCPQINQYARIIEETRRLIEDEGAQVVVGTIGATEGTVLRRLASRYPDVTFVLAMSWASSPTFRDPAPNVFRFGPTASQSVAGLGTYAYRELGWRTAAVLADEYPTGWEGAAAFGAEFCALGGRIVSRDFASLLTLLTAEPDPAAIAAARSADGLVVLSTVGVIAPLNVDVFLSEYAAGRGDLTRRLLLGGPAFELSPNLAWKVPSAGVVVAGARPWGGVPASRDLDAVVAEAFPELAADPVSQAVAAWYGTAADAVARALAESGDDLSDGQSAFRDSLAAQRFDAPLGPMRIDGSRQAVVTTYLGRVGGPPDAPTVGPFREARNVDQTLDGLLREVPQRAEPACVRHGAPAWSDAVSPRSSR
jgi:branched-chain amino acid transport system substrate-binding protein